MVATLVGCAIDPEQPLMEAGLDSLGEHPALRHGWHRQLLFEAHLKAVWTAMKALDDTYGAWPLHGYLHPAGNSMRRTLNL